MKTLLTTTLIGLLLVAIIGLATQMYSLRQQAYNTGYGDGLLVLPSIEDIQRRVGATPDGIVGKETITKWDAAICQQCANVHINDRTMGIKK